MKAAVGRVQSLAVWGLAGFALAACANGAVHNYACGERTIMINNSLTGLTPQTIYSFCPCPEDKPCPELDVRNEDEPALIIRRVEPPDN